MLFANACDSDVDDDNEPAEKEDEDDEEVAAAEPTATDEAEVDWNADEAAAWEGDSEEVAVVTMVGCPVFERNEELCNFDRSVLVLLAAVTSEASLPTRTVQGAEGDQWRTPKPFKKKKKKKMKEYFLYFKLYILFEIPVKNINKIHMATNIETATIAIHLAEQRAAKSLRKFMGAE